MPNNKTNQQVAMPNNKTNQQVATRKEDTREVVVQLSTERITLSGDKAGSARNFARGAKGLAHAMVDCQVDSATKKQFTKIMTTFVEDVMSKNTSDEVKQVTFGAETPRRKGGLTITRN